MSLEATVLCQIHLKTDGDLRNDGKGLNRKAAMYTPKDYGHADTLSLGNEAKQRGRKIFPLKLCFEFLILLAASQPSSTYKELVEGGVNAPNLITWLSLAAGWNVPVLSHWEKGITASVLDELSLSGQSWPWVYVPRLQEMEWMKKILLWLVR